MHFTAAITALVLAGCGLHHGRDVGTTEPTGAVITVTRAASPSPPQCSPEVPATWVMDVSPERAPGRTLPEPVDEHGTPASTEGVPAYDRPPLHEPMGSTYSDVGMPYPLRDIPVVTQETRRPPIAQPPPPAPFFETSFGPTPASTGFPESSFGTDAAP